MGRTVRLTVVLLCLVVAAGCASLAEVMNLRTRIQEAGYTEVSVNHNTTNGFDTVSINANKPSDDGAAVARLVWDTYPAEVDRVAVTVNGTTRSATHAELEELFGPRKIQPASSGISVGAIVGWFFLALLLIGTLITVLIVRSRRRRRRMQLMPPPPYPGQPQPGPYYQQPPYYKQP